MRSITHGSILGVLVLFVAPLSRAHAEATTLAPVPAKAPIVVQLNGFEKAQKRLGALISNAVPDIAPKVTRDMSEAIKELFMDRDLKAIKQEKRIFVTLLDFEGITEDPQIAAFIPVTSFAEFRDSFLKEKERKSVKKEADGYYSMTLEGQEDPVFAVDRKDTVVICKNKDNAKFFAAGDYAGLDTKLTKAAAEIFLQSDISVYVDLQTVNKQYGTQIKGFKALIELGLMGAGAGIDKKQIEMVKQLFNGFTQILEDGVAFFVTIDFRPDGGHLKMVAQFGEKTGTNDFLKLFKPAKLGEITTLPEGSVAYSASNLDLSKSKTLASLLSSMAADDENETAKKAIEAALAELAEMSSKVQLSAMQSMQASLTVTECADPAKMLAANLKLYRALTKTGIVGNVPLKDKPAIAEGSETVGNVKLTHVKMAFDIEKAIKDLPEEVRETTKASMTKLVGDGTQMWLGQDGKRYFQVTAKDAKSAKELLERYLDGKTSIGKDEGYLLSRKQLSEEASMLMMLDTARVLEMGLDMVKDIAQAVPGFPGAMPELKAPKGKPAFTGVAIVLKPEFGSVEVFVPTTAVQQLRKMFAPLLAGDN